MKKILLLMLVSVILASCGVKGHPDIPEGAKYKRTYPAV